MNTYQKISTSRTKWSSYF